MLSRVSELVTVRHVDTPRLVHPFTSGWMFGFFLPFVCYE